jgi:hypothetical protein
MHKKRKKTGLNKAELHTANNNEDYEHTAVAYCTPYNHVCPRPTLQRLVMLSARLDIWKVAHDVSYCGPQ